MSSALVSGMAVWASVIASVELDSDHERLQGIWVGQVGRLDAKGRFQGEGYIEIVFQGNSITGWKRGHEWLGEGTFSLDPAKKTIDVRGVKGDYRERYLGTYELRGDELRWATTRGGPRRAKLPPDNEDDVVLVLRRKK
ncbi:hypothetical protein HRbin36_02867 [bacterium HR36]|nr:hypothetical protein HRbin36_02867 [bacterium HR36]